MSCGHGRVSDFKRNGQWVCSHCGKSDAWSDSWAYHGLAECKVCLAPAIDYVACSDKCRDAMNEARVSEAAVVSERKRKAQIDEIDRQMADLNNRRARLAKKDEAWQR